MQIHVCTMHVCTCFQDKLQIKRKSPKSTGWQEKMLQTDLNTVALKEKKCVKLFQRSVLVRHFFYWRNFYSSVSVASARAGDVSILRGRVGTLVLALAHSIALTALVAVGRERWPVKVAIVHLVVLVPLVPGIVIVPTAAIVPRCVVRILLHVYPSSVVSALRLVVAPSVLSLSVLSSVRRSASASLSSARVESLRRISLRLLSAAALWRVCRAFCLAKFQV